MYFRIRQTRVPMSGFPGSSASEESACNAGDPSLIPGSGSSPGEGIGYLFQCSWASLVTQTVKNPTTIWETWVWPLGWEDFPGGGHSNPLQYSCLENPHGQRSLASCSPWGRKKWDTIEQLSTAQHKGSSINPYLYQLSQLTNLSKTHVSHLYITGVPCEPKLAFRDAFVIHQIHRPVLLGITWHEEVWSKGNESRGLYLCLSMARERWGFFGACVDRKSVV